MGERLASGHIEAAIVHPLTRTGEIDFNAETHGRGRRVLERERFTIIAREQIRIGSDAGLDGGIFPRAAEADGFAEAPKIVHDPEPNRGLTVSGAHDAGIRIIRAYR